MKQTEAVARERIIALIESEYDSDAAFEREMELPPKTVNNWRRGRSASFMKLLPALAEGFEVSVGTITSLFSQSSSIELHFSTHILLHHSSVLSLYFGDISSSAHA